MKINCKAPVSHLAEALQTVHLAAFLKDFGINGIRVGIGIDYFQSTAGNIDNLLQVVALAAKFGLAVSPTFNMNGKINDGQYPTVPVTPAQIEWNVRFWQQCVIGLITSGAIIDPVEIINEPGEKGNQGSKSSFGLPIGTIAPQMLSALRRVTEGVKFHGLRTLINFAGDHTLANGIYAYKQEAESFAGSDAEWLSNFVNNFSSNCYMSVPPHPYDPNTNRAAFKTKFLQTRAAFQSNPLIGTARPFLNREFGCDLARVPEGIHRNVIRADGVQVMRDLQAMFPGFDCSFYECLNNGSFAAFETPDSLPIDNVNPFQTVNK